MTTFLRTMSLKMIAEPGRSPDVMRALLLANLSSSTKSGLRRRAEAIR